jgi:hypothetical protein
MNPEATVPIEYSKAHPLIIPNKDDPSVIAIPTFGPFLYPNGATYCGGYWDGQRSGIGKQTWRNGSVYEGYWENDMANGFGR